MYNKKLENKELKHQMVLVYLVEVFEKSEVWPFHLTASVGNTKPLTAHSFIWHPCSHSKPTLQLPTLTPGS